MRKVYLLSVEGLRSPQLYQSAIERLDQERRARAERYRDQEDRIRSAGAGLLLQLAAREAEEYRCEMQSGQAVQRDSFPGKFQWQPVSPETILRRAFLKQELEYRMGEDGKPYLADQSFQFSLSHSGEYVICAVSDVEVGADIQEKKHSDYQKLVSRFFTGGEQDVFASCRSEKEKRDLFFLLWTRKEAYGKLTGKGLKEGLNRMPVLEPELLHVNFEEYNGLPGYQGSVCWKSE